MTTLLIKPDDKTVTITVQQRTLTPPQDAFRILAPIDLPTVFRPVFPFPGVSGVKNQTEAWDHAGARRNPQFDDGSQADEEITEYTPGSNFAYQLTNFTNVLSRLTAGARGEFNVNPDGDGTLIRWTTSSSRCPADAGSSPVPSPRSGAATWPPPSTGASASSKGAGDHHPLRPLAPLRAHPRRARPEGPDTFCWVRTQDRGPGPELPGDLSGRVEGDLGAGAAQHAAPLVVHHKAAQVIAVDASQVRYEMTAALLGHLAPRLRVV